MTTNYWLPALTPMIRLAHFMLHSAGDRELLQQIIYQTYPYLSLSAVRVITPVYVAFLPLTEKEELDDPLSRLRILKCITEA